MAYELNAGDFYLLTKINRLVIPFASFILGFLLSNGVYWSGLALPLLSILFIYASAATLNDLFDIKIDEISNPERPLPSRKIGKTGALVLILLFAFVGFIIAYWVSTEEGKSIFFWLIVLEFLFGVFYNIILSKHFITANATLACSHGLILFLAATNLFNDGFNEKSIIIGLGLWVILFLTYNLKDLKDSEGDRFERNTLPTIFGIEHAKKMNWFFLVTTIPVALLVFWFAKTSILSLVVTVMSGGMLTLLGDEVLKATTKNDFVKLLNRYRVLLAIFLLGFGL